MDQIWSKNERGITRRHNSVLVVICNDIHFLRGNYYITQTFSLFTKSHNDLQC